MSLYLIADSFATICDETLAGSKLQSRTQLFLEYVAELMESGVVGSKVVLQNLEQGSRTGNIANPILEQDARESATLSVHRDGLQELIDQGGLDANVVHSWVNAKLASLDKIGEQKQVVQKVTQSTHYPMVFHTLPAGSVWMINGRVPAQNVKIERPFDLMETPVTRYQWSQIMYASMSIAVNNTTDYYLEKNQDRPIDALDPKILNMFFKKLNALAKLSRVDSAILYDLIPDHRQGDQYRLPFEDEWLYVARDLGRNQTGGPVLPIDKMDEHVWHLKNSNRQTQPVAQLKPIVVGGKPFYDLFGNVAELVLGDFWEIKANRSGVLNNFHISYGKSSYEHPEGYQFKSLSSSYLVNYNSDVGIRLVRERQSE